MRKTRLANLSLLIYTGIAAGILVFGLSAFFLPGTQAKVSINEEERKVINDINDYRAKKGLHKLKVSVNLSEAALAMAQDMADNPGSINHEHLDSKGRDPSVRAALYGYTDQVGENLAAGYNTADSVFKAWKNSAEHNANLVDGDYEVMGVARVTTGNNYKWYWVNMFGTKEHASDLLNESNYLPLKKVQVKVTGPDGKPVKKAKVVVFDENRNKIDQGNTNTKGSKTFKITPKDIYYIRASATGFSYYTKKVKPGSKKNLSVKIWLEK